MKQNVILQSIKKWHFLHRTWNRRFDPNVAIIQTSICKYRNHDGKQK